MPSGRTHIRIETVALLAWSALATILFVRGIIPGSAVAAFLVAYLASMLFLSPDLDLRRSRPSQRWGIARILWRPYARIFRHRRLSHHLVLGPLTRIVYLALLTATALGLLRVLGHRFAAVPRLSSPTIGAAVGGVYLPNLTHILVDRLASVRPPRRSRKP